MRFLSRAGSIAVIVLRILWIIFAVLLWISGLVMFRDDTSFGMWFGWGAICAIPMCVRIIRQAFASAREGAVRGSREYTVSYSSLSDTYHVSDNSGSGCLWGFVGGLLGGIVIGPVLLPFYVVTTVIAVVLDIRYFASMHP